MSDWSTWKTFWIGLFCFLAFTVFVGAIVTGVVTDPNRGKRNTHITQVKQYGKDCLAVPKSDDDDAIKAGMYCKENW